MKKKIIVGPAFILFLTWIFTGAIIPESENKPIRKITQTTGLYLFGLRRIWEIDRTEKWYNRKGKITEMIFYDGSTIHSKYSYRYTEFDSVAEVIWYTGEDLSPQTIERFTFDSLRRPFREFLYDIDKKISDTTLRTLTTKYYDSQNRNFRTTIQDISKEYPASNYTLTMIDNYDENGFLISDTTRSGDVYIATYSYDKNGFIKTKFGGMLQDSIYYKTNDKGLILEEKKMAHGDVVTCDKFEYDDRGNKISHFLDRGNGKGHTYRWIYDNHNKLVKESLSGGIPYILEAWDNYQYEYY